MGGCCVVDQGLAGILRHQLVNTLCYSLHWGWELLVLVLATLGELAHLYGAFSLR